MEIRTEILDRLKARNTSIEDFNFDTLWAPPLLSFLTVEDIEYFRRLATSIKYSAKIQYKYNEIDRIMKMRGFRKLGAGTNRVCYRYLENNQICIKIAVDAVGMKDNPREFKNQEIFKPFVTKIFEVSPCGTVALVERVEAIKSREEFVSIAGDVYDMLTKWFIGKYVLEDVGSKTWMNIGVRTNPAFGPVLLDFPYVYEIDGAKLYCSLLQDNGQICNGEIDYDDGFNYLKCTKCGAKYKGIELQKAVENNSIFMERTSRKEGSTMKVVARKGKKVVKSLDSEKGTKKVIGRREKEYLERPPIGSGLKVKTSYVKKGINIPEEVAQAVNPSAKVEEKVEEVDREIKAQKTYETPVIEEVVEDKQVVYNTDSKFIPTSDVPTTEDPTIDIPDESAGEAEVVDDEVHEEVVEEETPAPDVEEEEVVDAKEPAAKKTKRSSKKFDPDFYSK